MWLLLETRLFEEYNSQRSAAAIRKWQLSEEYKISIRNLIFGVCDRVRGLMRAHLNFNKWEQSGTHPTAKPRG